MTSDDVSQLIAQELATFTYQPPSREGLLGVPWLSERMTNQIETLRQSLVKPTLTSVEIADDPKARTTRHLWVVTRPDAQGYILIYDPDTSRFGLAVRGSSSPPESVAVWGDLVTTYASR